jgi:hypothetical protein
LTEERRAAERIGQPMIFRVHDVNNLAVSHTVWPLEAAAGINDAGRSVDGARHAFLLAPPG